VIGTVSARVGDRVLPIAHTTPEATDLQATLAAMRDDDVATVAMEVSSHALDQHRVDATNFAAACFTNLSHDHLDYHGSLDAYFAAKARLFTPEFTRHAAVHVADEYGARLARQATDAGLTVMRFAVGDPEAEVRAHGVELRATALVRARGVRGAIRWRSAPGWSGRSTFVNALAAAATALLAGFDLEGVAAGLERPIVVPGRMERIDAGQDFTVLVDYAHTPDALENALGAARELAGADARVTSCSAAAVIATAQAARDGRDRGSARGSHLRDDRQPRSEDPGAIVDEIVAGIPAGESSTGGDVVTVVDRQAAIGAAIGGAGRATS
jgi:UDP-N-acetylmuramoyl-L-alanyl-D-glutamate--2,6-diaminopimelate ligase